jgi:hypothetical protein
MANEEKTLSESERRTKSVWLEDVFDAAAKKGMIG